MARRRQTWPAQDIRLRDGRVLTRNVREHLDPLWVGQVFVRYGMARVKGSVVAVRSEHDFSLPEDRRLPLLWVEVEPIGVTVPSVAKQALTLVRP